MRSLFTAVLIAAAIQTFTVGVLAPLLPRQVCRPLLDTTRNLSFPPVAGLRLVNADGAVHVRTHDQAEIQVQARIRAYAGEDVSALAEEYVAGLLRINADSDLLEIVTEPRIRPDEVDLRVDYVITVPTGTDIDISGTNGNVNIAKGSGRTRITGNNRDIRVQEPLGPVEVEITNGRIQVYDTNDTTQLKTINGKIYAHVKTGALEASTTNGNIVVTLLNSDVISCDLKSLNGGITLVMPAQSSAQVEAVTARGVVRSDFDVRPLLGHQRQRQLRGIIGEGHARLSLNSLNGNIWLAKE